MSIFSAIFPGAADRLTALDAAFLYLERPTEPLHVGAVMLLEGPVPYERFVAVIGERLAPLRRYHQRPVRPWLDLALPQWTDDPEFDVRRHVYHARVAAPGGNAELHELVDRLFATPCSTRAPLWETYLIDGLADGRSAILTKVHHCMVDGVSGAKVLEVMTDPASAPAMPPAGPPTTPAAKAETGILGMIADGALAGVRTALTAVRPVALAGQVRDMAGALSAVAANVGTPLSPTPLNGVLGAERRIVWASFPLDEFLALRGAAGCKVNDVVLAVVAGALRRYLLAHGINPPADGIRTLVPVNVRRGEDALALGNRVSALFATLPVAASDPIERLARIVDETRALKGAGQSRALELALAFAGTLPAPSGPLLARLSARRPPVHTVCTNVPGPREARCVLGQRVLEMHPIVPIALGMGLGFAILSYGGRLSIAATSDPALVPGAGEIPDMLQASLEELEQRIGAITAPPPIERQRHDRPQTTVGDLMTTEAIAIAPHDTLATAWLLMRERRIRHLPVIARHGRLVGLVTHRDLLGASQSSLTIRREDDRIRFLGATPVSEIMETHLSTARRAELAGEAGARMVRQKIGCLPVVEDDDRLVGIVTEEDFLRWATAHMAATAA
jgi:WS/DGAT/MGAT family acyltransferase